MLPPTWSALLSYRWNRVDWDVLTQYKVSLARFLSTHALAKLYDLLRLRLRRVEPHRIRLNYDERMGPSALLSLKRLLIFAYVAAKARK